MSSNLFSQLAGLWSVMSRRDRRRPMLRSLRAKLRFEALEERVVLATTFGVTTTADSGMGSLRQAILDANITSGADTITFNIPGAGPYTLQPLSALPTITDPVVIDGTTQPGFAGFPIIELNGSTAVNGLTLTSGDSTIKGLVINHFGNHGILITGSDANRNVITGNFIGTSTSGLVAMGNGLGIEISNGASYNTVGGLTPDAGNLISGNTGNGILLYGKDTLGNKIQGNTVGLAFGGNTVLGNGGNGVEIVGVPDLRGSGVTGPADTLIGGSTISERNIISANGGTGLRLGAGPTYVRGNYIGTDATGMQNRGNTEDGIYLEGAAIIGGQTVIPGTGLGNLISGNGQAAVFAQANIRSGPRGGGVIQGNLIGLNKNGDSAIGSSTNHGIFRGVEQIGGTSPLERNIISGHRISGIYGGGGSIQGNYIGTNIAGTAAVPNGNGVWLSPGSTLGGSVAGAGNLISGNANIGVEVSGYGGTTSIFGNYIGTNASGTAALGNFRGVVINESFGNRVGSGTPGAGNVISGNRDTGILLTGSYGYGNVVAGNYIGTNATGTAKVANTTNGVTIQNGASRNTIGSTTAGERNIISGNTGSGVTIEGTATRENVVAANYVGTDAGGTAALGNGLDGIVIRNGASSNRVGGTAPGAGNVVSGNVIVGVSIHGGGTTNNAVQGNYIGLDKDGAQKLANGYGVALQFGTTMNTVGGTSAAARNIISGSIQAGVYINSSGTSGNTIQGNYIGTTADGTAARGNGNDGVVIFGGASSNTIGGTAAGTGNVISGNARYGVLVNGTNSNSNVILGNRVGTNAAGTGALKNEVGIRLEGTADTVIGGSATGAGNLVSGNRLWGIELLESARAIVAGNVVGLNAAGTAAIPNIHGIIVNVNAADSRIGTNADGFNDVGERNVFAGNSGNNVLVQLGAKRTAVAGNYIGTDPSGTVGIFGTPAAIVVASRSSDTRIGTNGDGINDAVEANVIAAGLYEGVLIDGDGTDRTVVAGNRIGINAAGAAVPNGTGIHVRFGPADTRIGTKGDGVGDAAERNVIGGNNGWGIIVQTPQWNGTQPAVGVLTERTTIAGNYIGTNVDATAAMGNAGGGVLVQLGAVDVRIGTDGNGVADDAERNVISGNGGAGITIAGTGTSRTTVAGNFIGLDLSGLVPLGNLGSGVTISTGASNNRVGTNGDGVHDDVERNVISASRRDNGIILSGSGTSGNVVAGNYVGTDANGSATPGFGNGTEAWWPNGGGWGIIIAGGASSNRVGTDGNGTGDAAERNVLSGNRMNGLLINGASGNVAAGNYVGTDAAGTTPLPNGMAGICLLNASNNRIGTDGNGIADAAERNVISGNALGGLLIFDAVYNVVAGNYIGLDTTGTVALGNGSGNEGVSIVGNSQFNRIGTRGAPYANAERNIISGNSSAGISLGRIEPLVLPVAGIATESNTIAGNYIGTDASGTILVPNGEGIRIVGGAASNNIGSTEAGTGNLIRGNLGNGVTVVGSGAVRNQIRGNVIFANAGLGIDLGDDGVTANDSRGHAGPNNFQNFPVLTSALGGLTTTVHGMLKSTPNTSLTLDFYANATADPSGFGEGERYLGSISVRTDSSGNAAFDAILPSASATGEVITATTTDLLGNTSEFSQIPKIELSGRVFDDRNNDGLFNGADTGLTNVLLTLFNASNVPVATAITGADGWYKFTGTFVAGTYRIVAGQAAGFLDGKETAGSLGGTVDNTQDWDTIDGIVLQAGDIGTGYNFAKIRPSGIQALVWVDFNDDGELNFGEKAIAGVAVTLTGTDDRGHTVSLPLTTDAHGIVEFVILRPGNYKLVENQPSGFRDGKDTLGTVNGITTGNGSVNDQFSGIVLGNPGSDAMNYNFGERPLPGSPVQAGQTAGIGFWQNKNGQSLINALNGGPSATQLASWLATTFPSMYGAMSGSRNLTGKTNVEVAALFTELFKRTGQTSPGGPPNFDAQVLATALAVYVTNQGLAGMTAVAYGFLVTSDGVGTATFNVGGNGASFGVANNVSVSVLDLLLAVSDRTANGLLYDLDGSGTISDTERALRTRANDVFAAINELRGI